jgi:hypothetical protein
MNVLGASIFVIYTLLSGTTYSACYQPAGGSAVCVAMSASPHQLTVLDDTEYSFWVKVNGVDSDKVVWKTGKKTAPAPLLVER